MKVDYFQQLRNPIVQCVSSTLSNKQFLIPSKISVATVLITEDPLKSLNYQRLLTSYTEKCRYDSELWQIVNYFYLLKQIRQKDGENCFIESLAILLIKLNDNDIDNLLERLFGVNRQGIFTEVKFHFFKILDYLFFLGSYSRSS